MCVVQSGVIYATASPACDRAPHKKAACLACWLPPFMCVVQNACEPLCVVGPMLLGMGFACICVQEAHIDAFSTQLAAGTANAHVKVPALL